MTWIQNNADFAAWCAEACTQPAVAVDTEFMWKKTYYPELALLQMAWDREHVAIVDVLAITDPSPLRPLLENPAIVKIFHEAASDLPILHRWCQGVIPASIFDTRYAAGFAGLPASISLKALLENVLGISLAKTETCTDWLQRPLTPAQIDYAAGDVIYMPELYERLRDKLVENRNLPWFQEEMAVYGTPEYYEEIPYEQAWRKVSGYGSYTGYDLQIIVELAAWREQYARENNLVRSWIIPDDHICACAVHHPRSFTDLVQKCNFYSKQAKNYGEIILACVATALRKPLESCPKQRPFTMDSQTLKARSDRVRNLFRKRALARDIDPVLVGARRDADSFVLTASSHPWPFAHRFLTGWRHELLGESIDLLGQTINNS